MKLNDALLTKLIQQATMVLTKSKASELLQTSHIVIPSPKYLGPYTYLFL